MCSAALVFETPPAALTPTTRPVRQRWSRTTSSITSTTPGVAPEVDLAGRGLDHVRAGGDRQLRRMPHVRVGRQLGGLQDHLQVRVPARLLDGRDLARHPRVVARQVRLARDHHVDLGRARGDRLARLLRPSRPARSARRGSRWRRTRRPRRSRAAPRRPRRPARDRRRPRPRTGSPGATGPGRRPSRTGDGPCRACPSPRASSGRSSTSRADAFALRRGLDRAAPEGRGAFVDPDPVDGGEGTAHVSQCRKHDPPASANTWECEPVMGSRATGRA